MSFFKVRNDAHYLGGFIGGDNSKQYWIQGRMEIWEKNIHTISKNAVKYPKESYAAVVRAIQSECLFL